MEIVIKGTDKEIAALVVGLQERRSGKKAPEEMFKYILQEDSSGRTFTVDTNVFTKTATCDRDQEAPESK